MRLRGSGRASRRRERVAHDLVEGAASRRASSPRARRRPVSTPAPRTAPGRPGAGRCRAPAARANRRAASPGRWSAPRRACRAPPSRRRSPPRSSSCRRRPSRRRRRSACPRAGRRPRPSGGHRAGEGGDLVDPELGLEQVGQRGYRRLAELLEAGELPSLIARAATLRDRGPARGARRRRCATRRDADRRDLVLGEALRVEPVAEDVVDRDPDLGRRGRAPARRSRSTGSPPAARRSRPRSACGRG